LLDIQITTFIKIKAAIIPITRLDVTVQTVSHPEVAEHQQIEYNNSRSLRDQTFENRMPSSHMLKSTPLGFADVVGVEAVLADQGVALGGFEVGVDHLADEVVEGGLGGPA
jgi:hypothetical protein